MLKPIQHKSHKPNKPNKPNLEALGECEVGELEAPQVRRVLAARELAVEPDPVHLKGLGLKQGRKATPHHTTRHHTYASLMRARTQESSPWR